MNIVLNSREMRSVDEYMIETMRIPGLLLMENAAMGVCARIERDFDNTSAVHVFCGTGNNGGDGLAVARILLIRGYDVYVAIIGEKDKMTDDARANYAMFENMDRRARFFEDAAPLSEWSMPRADVVVDALFGTGLARNVEGVHRAAIEHINSCSAFTLAVDIPSGINADTGAVMGAAVVADATVTFQYPKVGHFLFPGRGHAGELDIVKIGVDKGCAVPARAGLYAISSGDEDLVLDKRPVDANKGNFGKAAIIAGSRGMAGAAVLCAQAAYRAGAGLVTVASVEEVVSIVQQSAPEATCKILSGEDGQLNRRSAFDAARMLKGKTALAIGPGIGSGAELSEAVFEIIKNHPITKVIDADAINALADNTDVLLETEGDVILTPHVKEFSRITDKSVEEILADPLGLARDFAKKYGVTLLLKGATTIVASGEGQAALVCAGSPGMAKGGSGDVLTGVITGLAAQGKSAFESAVMGAYFAASAGELATEKYGEYSMTPMDTIYFIGEVMKKSIAHKESAPKAQEEKKLPYGEHILAKAKKHENTRPEIPVYYDKTAEQALAEIEEREAAREFNKEVKEELLNSEKPGETTRRRIG